MKYYFTFGQSHVHKVNNITVDKDTVIEISSNNYKEARKKMFSIFENEWAFQYNEKPDMTLFPNGILKIK